MPDNFMQDNRIITVSLIRHAPSLYKKHTLPPVDPDVDLTQLSLIESLATRLPENAPWWVSPLKRCTKTAQALIDAGAKPRTQIILDALQEQDYGDWHGRPIADIWQDIKHKPKSNWPKSNWHFLHPSIAPPNGESFCDLITRLAPIIENIKAAKDDNIVIIAHSMVIKALIGTALRLTPEQSLALAVDYLSLTTLNYMPSTDDKDSFSLVNLNLA